MPEGGKNGPETFYVNPEFAGKMGMKPSEKKLDLPSLDDAELGYGSEEATAQHDMTFDQVVGEINSKGGGGEKTRVNISTVQVDQDLMGGDKTRIIDPQKMGKNDEATQVMDLSSLADNKGQNDKTSVLPRPKRKS
jgi:hypothetical protein